MDKLVVFTGILRLLVSMAIAYFVGRLVARIGLPSILGWLLTGIVIGPYAFGLLDASVLESAWFTTTEKLLECLFGLMIGTELVWKDMSEYSQARAPVRCRLSTGAEITLSTT